ncbi:MAG: hypothetical protein COU06_01985 [Candidatus Harrisonbacteria bacterium CG10_big_fil_rev_8_21_14_0_10_38_8]|uniref:Pyridoxamine 5'-phosphate oxidase N-terminal domain-containing protein n=1 Tax=Candidatus Harrisonbacteria bacterium CG10_big_fil_rev_8_21_14_0_10_38_8 TaxID=1974582 RepID=A0A2M6WJV0_9BACT|nr:MAG: hypothetical protein COU06_01985 [Candidatus Harrisonbacteria bacterium CG10_big_fil_rev_8_21_14_0_10_38_8]
MTIDIKQLIKEVLDQGYLMSLATIDDSGVWVADVIYIHDDDLNIYWMSDPDVRHSQAITNDKRVAGTITVSGVGENDLGIQFEGVAEKIEGSRYDLALKHYTKRKKATPKESEDVLKGDSWYILKPKRIELINEKLYGFDKKKIDL